MTLHELNGKYARLRDEIESLWGDGKQSQAKLARLMFELDQIDQEFAAVRRRALNAPVLREVVGWIDPSRQRIDPQARRA